MRNVSRPSFLKDPFWRQYVDDYVNEPGYWYQPKGLAISPDNLPLIQKRLRELARLEGQHWKTVQAEYTRTLVRKHLVSLRKSRASYARADFAAISRMNKVVFDTLGLAWTDTESTVFITDTGREFLRSRNPSRIVEKQLLKYQLTNPCFGPETASIRLFPHLFLLDILLRFPQDGITRREYVLFVARAKAQGDLDQVVERIRRFRELTDEQQCDLVKRLKTFPVVKEGRLSTQGRRTSLYNTVDLNSAYSLRFFAFPDYIDVRDSGRIAVRKDRLGPAVSTARVAGSTAFYTDFANEKDWFSHYGDPRRSGSVTDAMEYYESRSDLAGALRAYTEAHRSGLVRMKPGQYVELRVREKMLEDFLEFNLSLLEKGLMLVGRQYATPTGPIDLLAKDARRQFVVIELKKGRASDKVVGQLQRYRGYILQELARPGKRVRGMIVAHNVDKALKYAVQALRAEPVQLFRFAFQADVREVK